MHIPFVDLEQAEDQEDESSTGITEAFSTKTLLVGCALLAAISASGLYSFLLFHSLAEIFSIVIASGVFMVAWNTRHFAERPLLMLIGIAYLFVGMLDLAHTLSYSGMNIIQGYGANAPTQLWIAARYMESFSLLAAPFVLRVRINPYFCLSAFTVVTAGVLSSVFAWRNFPDCFLPATGLTAFKIVSEYIICFMLLAAGGFFLQRRSYFEKDFLIWTLAAILFTVLAELAFTAYASVFGFMNMLGHLFKIVSFYLIYKAIIQTSLIKSYKVLFRDLYRQRNHLQVTMNSIKDGVITTNAERRITFLNPVAESLTGWQDKEARGKPVREIFHIIDEHNRESIEDPLLKVLETGSIVGKVDAVLVQRSGSETPIDSSGATMVNKDGSFGGIVLSFRDVSERIRAERALRDSEEKFRSIFEQAAVGIGMVGFHDARWMEVNDTFSRMVGYTPEELQRTPWPQITHPDDLELDLISFQKMAAGKLESYSLEKRFIHKEGHHVWAKLTLSLVRNSTGQPDYEIAIIENISERKKAEKALQQRTEELLSVNRELESFSYSVSHDLRAPLRAIIGFSSLLRNHTGQLDGKANGYLQRITTGAEKMNVLIDDMLRLSRISRQELDTQEIDLRSLAKTVAKELELQYPERHVEMHIANDLKAKGDEQLIKIALTNLLGNAWKYTAKNAVARVEFDSFQKNNEKIFFIRDNGAGFSAKLADRMFKPFQRLHSESEFSGTGIGLPIAQRVINRHGGEIWAEGDTGKGAIFYFTLGK